MKINSSIKAIAIAASALSLAAVAAPASAGVVTLKASGQWTNAVGGSNVDIHNNSGNGDAEISWGSTRRDHTESSYVFDAKNVGAFNLSDGDVSGIFTLADFTHINKGVAGEGIKSVDLVFNTKVYVDGDYITNLSYTWNFKHDETADTFVLFCAYGGTGLSNCNDKASTSYGSFGGSFQVGDDLYTLDLSGFEVFSGGSWVPKTTFITAENSSSTAKIRGQLSMVTLASAVPEPATWAMMLVGFFGAGTALRSSRRKELTAVAA